MNNLPAIVPVWIQLNPAFSYMRLRFAGTHAHAEVEETQGSKRKFSPICTVSFIIQTGVSLFMDTVSLNLYALFHLISTHRFIPRAETINTEASCAYCSWLWECAKTVQSIPTEDLVHVVHRRRSLENHIIKTVRNSIQTAISISASG